jgi:hypothetical protein
MYLLFGKGPRLGTEADEEAGEGSWAWSDDSILPADERALVEQSLSGNAVVADTKIERH